MLITFMKIVLKYKNISIEFICQPFHFALHVCLQISKWKYIMRAFRMKRADKIKIEK